MCGRCPFLLEWVPSRGSQGARAKRLSAEPRLRRAEHGADAATADLYERYGAPLYRYCFAHLRSREDAEDAVQNTFLRVYAALRKGVVPEFETAWLYKIAHNVCLSRHLGDARRAKVESPHDLQLLEARVAAPQSESDELVGLDDALASMPPNLRRAILLREWQGLSYAEIAETLGLSHSAVETLIFRARRHLAQALERNVKQPARKIASALNLGPLAGAFRDLLARGGAAQLATGAVVAVGVAGGGFAISYTLGAPKEATSAAGASSPSAAGVVGSSQAPSGDGGSSRRGGFVALPGTPLLVATQAGAADSTSTGSAPTGEPGAPGSGSPAAAAPQEPTAVTSTAGPGAAPPPPASDVPGVVPNPALPTAEAPPPPQRSGGGATTGDAPTLPTLTAPTVTAPTVPTVTTPTVDTPTLPTVTTPTVDTLTLPTVTTPTLTTPTLTTPTVTAPTVDPPPLTAPTLTTPTLTTPTLTTPTVTMPTLPLP